MYDLIKYIHVVAAIIWVGGAVYIQILAYRVQHSDDPSMLARLGPEIGFIGTRVFAPASIILFIAGVLMVLQRWQFQQLWISVAMLLWFVSLLVGILFLGPQSEKLGALVAAEGPASPNVAAKSARLFLVSRLELISFAVIVALMVFKPGI